MKQKKNKNVKWGILSVLAAAVFLLFSRGSFADEKQDLIMKFHTLIQREEYPSAYMLLSHGLQNQINMVEFIETFTHFNEAYGQETVFQAGRVLNEEKENPFNMTTYEYVSRRNEDIFYAFSVMEEYGQTKIAVFKYFVPKDKWGKVYDGLADTLKLGW